MRVEDTGPGLEDEDRAHAFERFYLHERYGRERPVGTGLGLAIVKELTQAMGGTVEVEIASRRADRVHGAAAGAACGAGPRVVSRRWSGSRTSSAPRGVIAGRVHRTPVTRSGTLSEQLGAEVLFKAELFQRTGAFKVRGVLSKLSQLSADEKARGVISISAGNHAQAVAWGAREEGLDALVVMWQDASPLKIEATRGYGAAVDDSRRPVRRRRSTTCTGSSRRRGGRSSTRSTTRP